MDTEQLENSLDILRNAKTDNEKIAALILIPKMMVKAEKFDEETMMKTFEAVDLKFLVRLMKSNTPAEGCEKSTYKSVAVTVLSCFCKLPSVVCHPSIRQCLKCMNDIICSIPNPPEDYVDASLICECYQCLEGIASHAFGRQHMVDCQTVAALCLAFLQENFGWEKALELLLTIVDNCDSSMWSNNTDFLSGLLCKISQQFADNEEEKKFELCNQLAMICSTLPKDTRESRWSENVHTTLFKVLQNKLGTTQREPALKLAFAMVDLYDIHWLLGREEQHKKWLLLLVALASIEVRMVLEHSPITKVAEKAGLLCACFGILEHVIEYLTLGPSLSLAQAQVLQLHSAMQGAFAAVIFYLSNIESEHREQMTEPIVLASVRVLGSWIAEETTALKDGVVKLLPFLLEISNKTFESIQSSGESVPEIEESPETESDSNNTAETFDKASSHITDSPTNDNKNSSNSVLPDPSSLSRQDILKFLLPGLLHLSAEDKARRVLIEEGFHELLARYFNYHWKIFTSSNDEESTHSEIALTTMCGVFLNTSVLEVQLISTHIVFEELLSLFITVLPSYVRQQKHIVLVYNVTALSLMIIRHRSKSLGVPEAETKKYFTSVIGLLSQVHTTKTADKITRLDISDNYVSSWQQISELWMLSVQAFSNCMDKFSWLPHILVKSGWIPSILRLLSITKGKGVDAETATCYQELLCSAGAADPNVLTLLKEKNAAQVSKMYHMDQLAKILS